MSLLSWLASPKTTVDDSSHSSKDDLQFASSRSARAPAGQDSFNSLADQVESIQAELAYAQDLCEQANLQFDKYRIDIFELQKSLAEAKAKSTALEQLLATIQAQNALLDTTVKRANNDLKQQLARSSQLEEQLRSQASSTAEAKRKGQAWCNMSKELQFDLEYLKCVSSAENAVADREKANQATPLPAQPFVVVLVDGDAYHWSTEIYRGSGSPEGASSTGRPEYITPGGLAAHNIQKEVIKYMVAHSSTIPVTSKIVVRVFCNAHWMEHPTGVKRLRKRASPLQFMVQFTEKMPLFDYFDCGRGKERADDKIRENFHLYLSSPNCHAIFLAACLDNGFARMLEQYTNHPVAYEKIVLVSPGFVALEIQQLGLKQTAWPSVFAQMDVPKNIKTKYERETKKIQARRLLYGLGLPPQSFKTASDIPDPMLLIDLVPGWDVNAALSKYSVGVGIRGGPRHPVNAVGEPESIGTGHIHDPID